MIEKRTCSFFVAAALSALAAPGVVQTVAPEQDANQAPGQKMVYKKITEMGSLVKRTKVCLTRAQWNRPAENYRRFSEQLQDDLRGASRRQLMA